MNTVGLVLHPTRTDQAALAVLAGQTDPDVRLIGLERDADRLPDGVAAVPERQFADRVTAVVSLGGDGTMLGAMRLVAARPVPVLGVNTGHLGFLVETQPQDLSAALEQLQRGDFVVEEHYGLRIEHPGGQSMAFNDAVLTRAGSSSVSVDLVIAGRQYGYYRCDAVVVATPHGSTAYNYAAGGPVVSPAAPVLVVTPVAPMAGIARAVVLDGGEPLQLSCAADGPSARLEIDGTDGGRFGDGDVLRVQLAPGAGQVVRLDPAGHAARNRIKLSLQDLPLRRDQLLELVPPELRTVRPEVDQSRST